LNVQVWNLEVWPLATFRCAAEFDRHWATPDLEQNTIQEDKPCDHRGYSRTRPKVAPRTGDYASGGFSVSENAMMILHHGWRSSASRRVRLCLEEKGLAYEGHVVDMSRMEHHSPEYLKINPLGVIPTLIHDGKPLHESGTICEYLDESFPDPPLRPDAPYERALMRNWIRHIDGLIHNLIIFNWRHHLQKVAEQWSDEELAEKLKNIPSKERQESWLRVARKPYTEEERDAARAKLVLLLDKMEDALDPSGWLVGETYSIADIAAVPFVKRIDEEIAPDEISAKKHPRVTDWWTKIQARPAFARANFGPFLTS
jgi:glutathione S-transferase